MHRFQNAGAQVYELTMLRLKRTKNPLYWFAFLAWIPIEVFSFIKIIKKFRIRLIHVNMESTISPLLAARLCKIPVVLHYRGKTRDQPKWFFNIFLPLIHRFAQHIFVISHATNGGFKDRNLIDHVEVLYNAIDLKRFQDHFPTNYFEKYPDRFANKKVITFLGRMDPQKRIADLIEAAHLLKSHRNDLAFAIIGGDPEIPVEVTHQKELEARVRSKSVAVYFLGRERNVVHVLKSSDALVLPSINEGFGRVVVEAMASETPVIVANSGALAEIVCGGKYGEVVPPCDPNSLAQAIEKILAEDKLKTKTKRAKIYAFNTFDASKHVDKIVSTYNRLLSKSFPTNRPMD